VSSLILIRDNHRFHANTVHSTLVIFVVLLVFMFKVMASNSLPVLGSPGALWDLLQPDVLQTQAYGAKDGSYLTMDSGREYIDRSL
jgi:hypothetical protein